MRWSMRISTTASIARLCPNPAGLRSKLLEAFAALDEVEERLGRQRYLSVTVSPKRICGCSRHCAVRRRLLLALQMQSAPHCRLLQPVELYARDLSNAGRRRDGRHPWHQARLLRRHAQSQPERAHSARPRTRFYGTARPPAPESIDQSTWGLRERPAQRCVHGTGGGREGPPAMAKRRVAMYLARFS